MKNILLLALLSFSLPILAKDINDSRMSSKYNDVLAKQHNHKHKSNEFKINKVNRYDSLFTFWGNKYSSYTTPKFLKAICMAESGLNPKAVSVENALGLCQLTLPTWLGIHKKIKTIPANGYFIPTHSIHSAAELIKDVSNRWSKATGENKLKLILASYNAGSGNIVKSNDRCNHTDIYDKIKQCLPTITGKQNSKQTIEYVDRVLSIYASL